MWRLLKLGLHFNINILKLLIVLVLVVFSLHADLNNIFYCQSFEFSTILTQDYWNETHIHILFVFYYKMSLGHQVKENESAPVQWPWNWKIKWTCRSFCHPRKSLGFSKDSGYLAIYLLHNEESKNLPLLWTVILPSSIHYLCVVVFFL